MKTTKTTRTASKTTRKTAAKKAPARKAPARKADLDLTKAGRAKNHLLEQVEMLGLIESNEADRLARKAQAMIDGEATGAAECLNWDKNLARHLAQFEAEGGDGKVEARMEALLTWCNATRSLPSTREGIETAVKDLKRVLTYEGATLFLRDPERSTVRRFLTVGMEVDLIGRIRFAEGTGFSSWVATRRKPVLYASLHRNEAPDAEVPRSFIAVPLVLGETCLGVLNLGHGTDSHYGQAGLRVAILAGAVLAGLVQRFIAMHQIAAREITAPDTGLFTERHFQARLEEEVVRCRELGYAMSLGRLNLVELEGHIEQFGDEYREKCRAELAEIVREWRKPTELVGHLAGEGIQVLLPAARGPQAQERLGALAERIRRHNFPRRKRMQAQWGAATYPMDAEDSQGLAEAADNAGKDLGAPSGVPHGVTAVPVPTPIEA